MRRIDIYMFSLTAVYFIAGLINIFVYKFTDHIEYIQMPWVILLCLPIFITPIRKWMDNKK